MDWLLRVCAAERMQLEGFRLQTAAPAKLAEFYTEVLGMEVLMRGEGRVRLGLPGQRFLELVDGASGPYTPQPEDAYWKFSLFVDDLSRVHQRLLQLGVEASTPNQFGEVGYLMHIADPAGHAIEFIQTRFKGDGLSVPPVLSAPLHERPVLGLLTLRTKDPIKSVDFFRRRFGLELFVRMYVRRGRGFSLYFLGDSALSAPSADIDAIENRPWMYSSGSCFIELQYYWGSEFDPGFSLMNPAPGEAGFSGILASGVDEGLRCPDGQAVLALDAQN